LDVDWHIVYNSGMDQAIIHTLDGFFTKHKQHHIKRGEYLIRAGATPDGVYYLKSGVVRQVMTTKKGEERTVNLFKPVAFLPLTWALGEIANRYDFIAMSPVEVWIAPAKETIEFLKTQPEVTFDLAKRLLSGLNALLLKNEQLMDRSARSRLVLSLLQLAYRHGKNEGETQVLIDLPLTHRELATISGLTRETVSNEMKLLERGKMIHNKHQHVTLINLDALEASL
jgi:CRP/FNR family cyclic AMP-dependent transcriptional regulator